MKAWIFVGAWVAVGLWVALRPAGSRRPAELALVLLFWPFFVAGGPRRAAVRAEGPLQRLRQALGDEESGMADELERALDGVRGRLARVEGALAGLEDAGVGPVGEARATSRRLLETARQRAQLELDEALAAVEEAATRLVLAKESKEEGQVEAILATLHDRLLAAEEVERAG